MFLTLRILLLFAIGCLYGWRTVESVEFTIKSCPLSLSSSFFSNGECNSSGSTSSGRRRRRQYMPYGYKHTYIQIDNTCYDWGNWNYPRTVDCNADSFICCNSNGYFEVSAHTGCADRIPEFEMAWISQNKDYGVMYWNCQVYSDAMKQYLMNDCDLNAVTVFQ